MKLWSIVRDRNCVGWVVGCGARFKAVAENGQPLGMFEYDYD
jgi:hypothetical protein